MSSWIYVARMVHEIGNKHTIETLYVYGQSIYN